VLPIHSRTARLLALCCCACRTASSSGDEPAATTERTASAARAGTTIPTPYYQIRASLPEECAAPEPALESAATRRIGIEIALQPTGDVQVPADPYYARLVDTHHNVYEATLGGCGAPLAPTLPARGQTAHGWIVFELPRTARAATLLYAPELVGASKTELAIDLQP
jgi:hypothetical protein